MLSTVKKLINRLINSTSSTNSSRDEQSWTNTMSFGKRTILWLPLDNEIQSDQDAAASITQIEQIHHIRHHGKHHKPNATMSIRHNHSQQAEWTAVSVLLNLNRNHNKNNNYSHSSTMYPLVNVNSTIDAGGGENNVRQTAICYTTNEVLFIIGLTCILNFAFIVLIMSCVHFCSSANTSKVADLPRLESLVIGDSEFGSKRTCSSGGVEILTGGAQDYGDSLPLLLFRPASESMVVSLQNLSSPFCQTADGDRFVQETSSSSSPQPDTHIPPSLSMENLLFTD